MESISGQYSSNNAWNYNRNNGNMNNNNKYNSFYGLGVSEFQQKEVFADNYFNRLLLNLYYAYFECRKNKRNTHNQISFEFAYPKNILSLCNALYNFEYTPRTSIAFIITKPKIREIMAASFIDRVVQTYYVMRLKPYIDKTINPHSYSCRVGMGSLAAVNNLYDDIFEVSEGYTKDCYIAKIDLKNFFMSIDKEKFVNEMVTFVNNNYNEEDKDLIIYLTRIIYYNLPQERAIRKSPLGEWDSLSSSKSLFNLPFSKGLAIGNLTAQFAANIVTSPYLDKIEEMGYKISHYTDDTSIVTNSKEEFLNRMPLIRESVSKENVQLSDDKFYFQHYSKKVPFLAYEIKKDRITPSKRVIHNCKEKIRLYNIYADSNDRFIYNNAEKYCSILNSYFGIFKHCHSYRLRIMLSERVMTKWSNVLECDTNFSKFIVKERYKKKNQKIYNIKKYRKWLQSMN